MDEIKKLGIWMCNTNVHLVAYTEQFAKDLHEHQSEETYTKEAANVAWQNEAFHNQTESFKKLATAIENYEEVVLFGPVDAKADFIRFLKADKKFDYLKIDVKQTHIMCEEQQQEFVENYFSNKLDNSLLAVSTTNSRIE